MKPSLILKTLPALIKQKASVNIIGAPGGGKTSVIQQVCTNLGWDGIRTDVHPHPETQKFGYIEVVVPTKLVEDFGIPDILTAGSSFGYKMPSWFPYEGHPTFPKEGVVNFDDRGQANSDLQKVIANIQQARNLHGIPMMEGWSVTSTGNRVTDRAGASQVLTHLADREITIEYETNLEDSCRWAISNGVHEAIVAAWRFKPSLLHDFDPNRDKNATPRGWCDPKDGITALIGKVPPEAELEVFKGRISEGHAIEFKAFLEIYRNLPDPENIIKAPDTHAVPKESSVLFALCGALATRATTSNFSNICKFAGRMPPEFATLLLRDAVIRDKKLATNEEFSNWFKQVGRDLLL